MTSRAIAVLALLAVVSITFAQADTDAVMRDLRSRDAGVRNAASEKAVEIGAPMVTPLLALYGVGTSLAESVAEKTLMKIVAKASAPGSEQLGAAVAAALGKGIESGATGLVRCEACKLAGMLGMDECVPPLRLAIGDDVTYAAALSALTQIPGHVAALGLVRSARNVPEARRPEVVRAVGARRDAFTAWVLIHPGTTRMGPAAVYEALGMIAHPTSAPTLAAGALSDDVGIRKAAVHALISLADAEQQSGGAFARRCYRRALDYATNDAQRSAALIGLAETDPTSRVKWLTMGLDNPHSRRLCEPLLGADTP